MLRQYCFEALAAGWRKLVTAASTHEKEVPAFGPFKAALEKALEDVIVSKCRQVQLKAKAEEATREVTDNVKVCREMARRLVSFVKANFSRSDERLGDFGIKIWSRPLRKPKLATKAALPGTTKAG